MRKNYHQLYKKGETPPLQGVKFRYDMEAISNYTKHYRVQHKNNRFYFCIN